MTERWNSYIREGIESAGGLVSFALTQWSCLFPVFLAIRRAVPPGAKILDVGCGASAFTALLAQHGYDVLGIDEDADIVQLGREMTTYFRAPARIEQGSAFALRPFYGQFDLVFSLGVLEHFAPDTTVQLLQEQGRCASNIIVAVPTRHTCHAGPITDERLYSRSQLCRLVRQADLRVRESFVYGEVPTALARNLERLLPGVLYRRVKHLLSYGMGACCSANREPGIRATEHAVALQPGKRA